MATCTLDNLLKSITNLNMIGTFDRSHTTIGTAIPQGTIGTYQLCDQLVAEVNEFKQQLKNMETKLRSK